MRKSGKRGTHVPPEEVQEATDIFFGDVPTNFVTPEKRSKLEKIMESLGGASRMIGAARLAEKTTQDEDWQEKISKESDKGRCPDKD